MSEFDPKYPGPKEVEQAERWLCDAARAFTATPNAPGVRDALLSAARGYTRLYDRVKGGT